MLEQTFKNIDDILHKDATKAKVIGYLQCMKRGFQHSNHCRKEFTLLIYKGRYAHSYS